MNCFALLQVASCDVFSPAKVVGNVDAQQLEGLHLGDLNPIDFNVQTHLVSCIPPPGDQHALGLTGVECHVVSRYPLTD